jgi:hypothetical protein
MNKLIINIEGYNNTYGRYPKTTNDCSCNNTQGCELFDGLNDKTVSCFNTRNTIYGNVLWFSIPYIKNGTDSIGEYSVQDYDVFRYHDFDGGCLTTMSIANKPKLYVWKYGGNLMLCDPGKTLNPAEKVCAGIYPDTADCKVIN